MFVEVTEKRQFPRFGLFRRGGIGAWQRQEKAPEEETALRRTKTRGFVIC